MRGELSLPEFRFFRRFKTTSDFEEPIGEINTTPLVDVMLVLLIIFLITIPVINASIKVDLPEERFNDTVVTDDVVILSVTKAGQVFFNGALLGDGTQYVETLSNLLKTNPRNSIQVHGDSDVSFDKIELIINQMRSLDVETITLVTKP